MNNADIRKLAEELRSPEVAYEDCDRASQALNALDDVVEAADRMPLGVRSHELSEALARLEALKP